MVTQGLDATDVDNLFSFHPATEVTGPLHDEVRDRCRALAHNLLALVPPSAERTTAIRKVQEAMMHANAGIACHSDTPSYPPCGFKSHPAGCRCSVNLESPRP